MAMKVGPVAVARVSQRYQEVPIYGLSGLELAADGVTLLSEGPTSSPTPLWPMCNLGRYLHGETPWRPPEQPEIAERVRFFSRLHHQFSAEGTEEPAPLKPEERPYDLVIYGATGYTGCLMVEHLDTVLSAPGFTGPPLRWALAGRNVTKLKAIAGKCQVAPDVLQVSTRNEILKMVGHCRVVAACVGPYLVHGEKVVAACVETRTHYVDISGETLFVHQMAKKYHAVAKERGVMIVHMVGQLVSPDDIMCYKLVDKLGPLRQCRHYFFQYGASSGGTVTTQLALLENMTQEQYDLLVDPFTCGGHRPCGVRAEDEDCGKAEQDSLFPALWLQPAYSSMSSVRMIRRTCELFEETPSDGPAYGGQFSVCIRDANATREGADASIKTSKPIRPGEEAAQHLAMLRAAVEAREVPESGTGAPEETRAMYCSEAFAVAEGESGEWAHVHYTGPEAYEVTAMGAVAGALVLVQEIDRLRPKERGGVLTPAYAFHGSTFVERLMSRGFGRTGHEKMVWEVRDGLPSETEVVEAMRKKQKRTLQGAGRLHSGELQAHAKPAYALPQ